MTELHNQSVTQLRSLLDEKKVSATELAQHFLSRMDSPAAREINAFIDIKPELTLAQAREADKRLAAGERGALLGMPLAHKDIFVTQGWRSTAGSKMLEHYQSPFDATVVSKLATAGVVTLGKTNCDEFAMGSANENSHFGPVKNPRDLKAVPGGSSGGSAAAVAAGFAPIATGTDTGGSVRQPAAFCGITGIKPTYGRCSRFGMIAFASSLDQAGVFGRSAADCAATLNLMAGFDQRDSTSVQRADEDLTRLLGQASVQATASKPLAGVRFGVPKEFFVEGVSVDVRGAVQAAIDQLIALGGVRVDVSLPNTHLAMPAYYVIAPAEASSNLSRFDGVRYGHRASEYTDIQDMMSRSRAQGFGPEVKRRILVGTYVLSHGYYDAYYLKAQKLRRLVANDFQAVFAQCDFVVGPVAPTVAWDLGVQNDDPVANYLADVFTIPASLAGLPGMSIPIGTGAHGRPVGLHMIGNYFDEARLLAVADAYQRAHPQTMLGAVA